jgi:8-amino-7-oxononanoate synthase
VERAQLKQLIAFVRENYRHPSGAVAGSFKDSLTPIQCLIVPGNEKVKALASHLAGLDMDIRPILYPTVSEGEERLRITQHSYNTAEELEELFAGLAYDPG